tara:strand:- start:2450 stop:3400 length:951 start_codon:yes stop_codon:yes gene_type:complete
MKKICVTGANGFIGKSICKFLSRSGVPVRGFVRNTNYITRADNIEYIQVGDITSNIDWKDNLTGYDCVIHCAGKAHSMNEINDIHKYYLINTEATKRLAVDAASAKVKRLIFLSTVKVNGESTDKILKNKKFSINDLPNPEDPYSISKFKAEKNLWEISNKTGLEVVIIRLPLVYGYGAKGNLLSLVKLIRLGLPLPFSLLKNKRSLIGIDNLVDIIVSCIDNPNAASKTFLVSDDNDLSTPDLMKLISSSMGNKLRLFPLPLFILKFIGIITRKQKEIKRLSESLQIDCSYAREVLSWSPRVSVAEGMKRMVKGK